VQDSWWDYRKELEMGRNFRMAIRMGFQREIRLVQQKDHQRAFQKQRELLKAKY